ncbi:DnaD domain protein [Brotaphodocola sp.]|uniref:DnaD domain protein n=1 Tax=Brotaphodocola sp. TaxID=3073577 RepID=UPI003D7C477A
MEDLFAPEDPEPVENGSTAGEAQGQDSQKEAQTVPAVRTLIKEDLSLAVPKSRNDRADDVSSPASRAGEESSGKYSLGTRGFQTARPSLGGLSALFGEMPIEQVRENSARVIGQRRGLGAGPSVETSEKASESEKDSQKNFKKESDRKSEDDSGKNSVERVRDLPETETVEVFKKETSEKESGHSESLIDHLTKVEHEPEKKEKEQEAGSGQDEKRAETEKIDSGVGEGMRTSAIWGREPRIRDAVPIAQSGLLVKDPIVADLLSAKTTEPGETEQSSVRQESGTEQESQRSPLENDEDFSQLLYIAQRYLNRIFTPRDVDIFANLYEGLHLSAEMLEYLVEYCVQNGHTSVRYIEAVGMNWHEKGFQTVEEARAYSSGFTKDAFAVMRAFGLNDRKPGDGEREMIEKWFKTYGLSRELVIEACRRTMEATHKPSFRYADKILSDWRDAGVKTMDDVNQIDEKRRVQNNQNNQNRQSPRIAVKAPVNRFHNFEQRSTDYDSLVLDQVKGWLGEQ